MLNISLAKKLTMVEQNTEQNNSLSLDTAYKHFRDYIIHEDALINIRLNWLLVIQGLLFTAFGLSISGKTVPNIDNFMQVISWVGILTCLLIFLSILTGVIAIKNIEALWSEKWKSKKESEELPFITGGEKPKSYKNCKNLKQRYHKLQYDFNLAFLPPLCIPLLFLVAWMRLMIKY